MRSIIQWIRIVLVCLLFFAMTLQAAKRDDYEGRWGLRLNIDGGVYGGYVNSPASPKKAAVVDQLLSRVSAGWMLPLQIEGTYSVTNAFEILLGLRYSFSSALFGNNPYLLSSIGANLGWRYYVNINEPIKSYWSGQVGAVFVQPAFEAKTAIGLQWDINNSFALFFQQGIGIAGLFSSADALGLGGQLVFNFGTGMHYRF